MTVADTLPPPRFVPVLNAQTNTTSFVGSIELKSKTRSTPVSVSSRGDSPTLLAAPFCGEQRLSLPPSHMFQVSVEAATGMEGATADRMHPREITTFRTAHTEQQLKSHITK
jgi:hypothetical protein